MVYCRIAETELRGDYACHGGSKAKYVAWETTVVAVELNKVACAHLPGTRCPAPLAEQPSARTNLNFSCLASFSIHPVLRGPLASLVSGGFFPIQHDEQKSLRIATLEAFGLMS